VNVICLLNKKLSLFLFCTVDVISRFKCDSECIIYAEKVTGANFLVLPFCCWLKLEFHGTDTDTDTNIRDVPIV